MRVTLMAANGRTLTIPTHARRESAACTEALRSAEAAYPGCGWLVLHAL